MVKIVIEVSDGVTNGDIIQNICSMWIEYHDTDIEVTVDKKVWNAPYKKVDMAKAIRKGTPLPKGHTALISKEQAIELVEYYQLNPQHFDFVNLIEEIKDEKPIIEADKE